MRRRIHLLALLALLATPALAESEALEPSAAPDEVDWSDWTPSIALGITIFDQDTVGTTYGRWHAAETDDLPTSPYDNDCNDSAPGLPKCRWITELGGSPPATVRDGEFFYDRGHLDGAAIPLSFELMAPVMLPRLPGRPRLFSEAGYQWPREPRFQAAFASSGVDTPRPNVDDLPRMELGVKMKKMWWAGVGASFHTELAGFPLQIRPSFNYFGQQADFKLTAESQGRVENGTDPVRRVEWQAIDETVSRVENYHGLGPKLAFDVEMGRRGPFSFHLMLSTYLAWFPSGLHFQQKGIVPAQIPLLGQPPVPGTPSGPGPGASPPFTPEPLGNETYEFRFDDLQPGGSIAIRVSWEGFSE